MVTVSRIIIASGSPWAANKPALAASMTTIALVGPLTRNSELPNTAPRIDATTAVAMPTDGGKPAISAYAIACGMVNSATVRPAVASARSVDRS